MRATMWPRFKVIVEVIGLPSKLGFFTIHKSMRLKVRDKSADEPLSGVGDSYSFLITASKTNRRRSLRWIAPPVDRYNLPRLSFRKLPYLQIPAFNPEETFCTGRMVNAYRVTDNDARLVTSCLRFRSSCFRQCSHCLQLLYIVVRWRNFPSDRILIVVHAMTLNDTIV